MRTGQRGSIRPGFGGARRLLIPVVVAAAGISVGPAPAAAGPTPARPSTPVVVAGSDTEADAVAAARESGRRVEVTSARTELAELFAEADGSMTYESAVVPQRARRPDGTWAPIDLTLRRDGAVWRPTVSASDVRFSAGGSGPLVTLVQHGRTLTMGWPGSLPAPVVAADAATYPAVLPDVDLVLHATETGFTHVLVVKTPAAAANPAVRQIKLSLAGDARVSVTHGGGLRAAAGDVLLATAPPPSMWDSRMDTSGTPGLALGVTADSTSKSPGDSALTAPVAATVSATGDLILTPDASLLTSSATTFPVYIDPAWSTSRSRWAYATHNNSNNNSLSVARVGLNPDSGVRYRSYFDFPLTGIRGKHIESAYVQMRLDHSWSCGNTYTHLFHTAGIASTPRTRWAPGHRRWLASAASHANEGSGCSDSPQPDMTVNFIGAAVTSVIQQHATRSAPTITIGLCACNADGEFESAQDRWKKFLPGYAKLVVNFSSYPGKPSGLQISGVTCPASGAVSIGTLSPAASAVYPDADRDQALTAAYEWVEVPASGVIADSTPRRPNPGTRSVPSGGRSPAITLPGVVNGRKYAYRTRATDPAPYLLVSPWSAWCQFTVDTAVPPPPVVTAAAPPAGPGAGVTFTFTVAATDVTRFRYGWVTPPLTEVVATGTGATRTATVSLTTPRYGQNTLYVHAIDVTGNKGNDASLDFLVARPSPAVARWSLETAPGTDQAGALADQQPGLGGSTPLGFTTSGPDVRWAPDVRLLGGSTATFNPTGDGLGGWLEAPMSGLDTPRSFSVAAWVRLFSHAGYQTVVGKDGAQVSLFRLQYRLDDDKWCFSLRARDVGGARLARACAVKPVLGQWTHLAGVYDDVEMRVRLYIDGTLMADVAPDTAWLTDWAGGWGATGPVTVGRGLDRSNANPPNVDHFKGEIADVQVFDRALVGHDFTGQRADDPQSGGFNEAGIVRPVEVGRWDFAAAVPCYQTGIADTCRAPDVSPWGRELNLTQGVDVGLGQRDSAIILDSLHWIDNPSDPFYGQVTQEYGGSRRNTAPEGQPAQWQDAPVLRTDQSFTVSAWVRPDIVSGNRTVLAQDGVAVSGFALGTRVSGTATYWSFTLKDGDGMASANREARSVAALTGDNLADWTHLVGVYDAQRKQIRLYVDGVLQGDPVPRTAAPWQAGGRLTVGRAGANGAVADLFIGTVDDVTVYQGALSAAAVSQLYQDQSVTVDQ